MRWNARRLEYSGMCESHNYIAFQVCNLACILSRPSQRVPHNNGLRWEDEVPKTMAATHKLAWNDLANSPRPPHVAANDVNPVGIRQAVRGTQMWMDMSRQVRCPVRGTQSTPARPLKSKPHAGIVDCSFICRIPLLQPGGAFAMQMQT